ncbi:hypothetical protein P0136_00590 [Lentisphaerota bacterium ZTH]|nr:hypothetical protein JYG24_08265 [Lentisphaerota bacterium]WET06512.1 hypothetical protein P0136_00590 [Lentisphaerota bacterium ZTH]
MKKSTVVILGFLLSLMPGLVMGSTLQILSKAKGVSIPPSIAENGDSFIYAAVDSKTKRPALFVSYKTKDGSFTTPVVAFDATIKPVGLKQHFQIFVPVSSQQKPKSPDTPTGFNSPTIQNGIITFSATLENGQQGVFYAKKTAGKWQVFPIALQGDKAPGITRATFKFFNAPYISKNSEAIFLCTLDNKTDVVYAFKVNAKCCKDKKFKILHQADKKLHNFFNISVAQGTFATRAVTGKGVTNMYIFDRKSDKLIKTVPQKYGFIDKGKPLVIGGPTYYSGKVAFMAFSKDKAGKIISGIFTNAGGNEFSEPFVHSGKKYDSLNATFNYLVCNPTLYISSGKAYIAFMGFPTRSKKINGVYLAEITDGKVKLQPVAIPGQVITSGMQIQTAVTGAVSIRNGIIPLAVRLTDGTELIATVNIQKK